MWGLVERREVLGVEFRNGDEGRNEEEEEEPKRH